MSSEALGPGVAWVQAWPSGVLPFHSKEMVQLCDQLKHIQHESDWRVWVEAIHREVLGGHQSYASWRKEEGMTQYRAQARLRKWLGPVLAKCVWLQSWPDAKDFEQGELYEHHHPKHPLPYPGWEEKAQEEWGQLCQKFGFTDIIFPSHTSLEVQFSWIREIDAGLSQLAQVYELNPSEIGMNRIGLALGYDALKGGPEAGALWHWLDRRIYIQNKEGWGSFAHEWCHAMDQHQQLWVEEKRGGMKFNHDFLRALRSTVMLRQEMQDESVEHRWMKERFNPLSTQTERWVAYQEWIAQIPAAFERLVLDLQDADLRERFSRRLEGLKKWTQGILQEPEATEKHETGWSRWEMGNEVLASACEQADWKERWSRLTQLVKTHWGDRELPQAPWLMWASFKDEIRGAPYWSFPHEALARSFHAVTASKMGHESWVADKASQVDWYPQGEFLKQEQMRWETQKSYWHRQWQQSSNWESAWVAWMTAPTSALASCPTPWCPEGQEWPQACVMNPLSCVISDATPRHT